MPSLGIGERRVVLLVDGAAHGQRVEVPVGAEWLYVPVPPEDFALNKKDARWKVQAYGLQAAALGFVDGPRAYAQGEPF